MIPAQSEFQLVQDGLEQNAKRSPDKVALICGSIRLTYAEIDRQAEQMAHALRTGGVQPGDRVVIHLKNGPEAVVAIFATLKAGAVFVVVNHTTKEEKLDYILNDSGATALFFPSGTRRRQPWREAAPGLRLCVACGSSTVAEEESMSFAALVATPSDGALTRASRPDDLACLIYTSGSTGDPKGVMSEHRNVVFAASSIIEYLENIASDIVLNALPLSFDYGLYQLLMTFQFGGTLVLADSFAYPAEILRLMEREKVTGFPGVPTIFAVLLGMDLSDFKLSHLRYITNTAAALPPEHILAIRRKFPDATLFSMYGLTETKRTLYLPPAELDRRPGSVGQPIPHTECWVEDGQGQRCPAGVVGELVVRGRHVMRGYWRAPEATARRFRPGPIPGERLCYTGDLFRQDEDGFFYFVARSDDIIKSRGEKVAPKEVESVLYSLAGVREAAVIGVPDPVLGQAIKAIVVPADGATLTVPQILAHCRQRLENFMVPQQVELRAALPKTASGKIAKRELA